MTQQLFENSESYTESWVSLALDEARSARPATGGRSALQDRKRESQSSTRRNLSGQRWNFSSFSLQVFISWGIMPIELLRVIEAVEKWHLCPSNISTGIVYSEIIEVIFQFSGVLQYRSTTK